MKTISKLILVLLTAVLTMVTSVYAKEYTKTSFYVAYDKADSSQYALVMPSINKVYTHKAGEIEAGDLTLIDGEFASFPTYDNGELCFPALKTGAEGIGGASIMAGNCYEVNYFYIQKETIAEGTAFILYYKPADKVYEGLAGKADTFKVVKDGETITSENSISGDDYTNFSFNVASVQATIDESPLTSLVAGNTFYAAIDGQTGTLESWTFNADATTATWRELVGGSDSGNGTVTIEDMTITYTEAGEVNTMVVKETEEDYLVISVNAEADQRIYFDEAKARGYFQVVTADTTAPVVTLNGEANISIELGESYTDAGAMANDDVDGTLTPTMSGSVDTQTIGTYMITYTAIDAAGNVGTVTRTVNVYKPCEKFNQITGECEDDKNTTSPLTNLIVGTTKYFVNTQDVTGYRMYETDGTYTGSVTSSNGSIISTGGNYTISGNVLTINRTSPSVMTLELTYLGEESNVLAFDIRVNGGETFQTYSFETEQAREVYLKIISIGGEWSVTDTVDARGCGEGTYTEQYNVTIEGDSAVALTLTAGGNTYTGSYENDQLLWNGSYPEDGGVNTISYTGEISSDCSTITGSSVWQWSNGTESCSGTSTIVAQKVNASGCGITSVSELSSLISGTTKHFINSKGVKGYRTYASDGTYTGGITQSDGSILPVSGTYEITGNVLTINRTSPSGMTLELTYLGEESEGLKFDISVNGGEVFQTYSFETEAGRDGYVNGLEDDHGNDISNATELPLDQIVNGSLEITGDIDFFEFVVPERGGLIRVSTSGQTDTYGVLYDNAGMELASEDDGYDGDINFAIGYNLEAGTYYVSVANYSNTQTGDYSISWEFYPNSPDDHGNFVTTATKLMQNQEINGSIDVLYDIDFFEITVPEGGGLISLFTTGQTDTYGILYDSSLNLLSYDDDSGENDNFLIDYNATAGIYYLWVDHYDFFNAQTGDYRVSWQLTPNGADDHGDSIEDATSLPQSQELNSSIETPDDIDVFELIVPEDGTISIFTTGGSDTAGVLVNASGEDVTFDDDSGENNNFLMEYDLAAGTYYVGVKIYDENEVGDYVISWELIPQGAMDDHGDDNTTATSITSGQTLEGSIETMGDVDYFKFVTPQAQVGDLTLTIGNYIATSAILYDETGYEVAANSALQNDNYELYVEQANGTYYLKVEAYDGVETGDYNVSVSFMAITDDHGEDFSTATEIQAGQEINGSIELGGDRDFFKIIVSDDRLLRLTTTGLAEFNFLYDASGAVLEEIEDGGVIEHNVTAGTYYVEVGPYNGVDKGLYSVMITLLSNAPESPLTPLLVGQTKYFADTDNASGYRTYAEDGTYTGVYIDSSGDASTVSGTYTIEGDILTLHQIAPYEITTEFTYVGEENGGVVLSRYDRGYRKTVKKFIFSTENARDMYATTRDCDTLIGNGGTCTRFTYYNSGVLRGVYPGVNGVSHGISIEYYENGQISYESNFVYGVEHGLFKSYYEDGTLKSERPYVDGKIHGIDKYYHENGNIWTEMAFSNGLRHGEYIKYYDVNKEGVIARSEMYRDDVLHGHSYGNYPNGNLEWFQNYVDGVGEMLRKFVDHFAYYSRESRSIVRIVD